MNPRAPCAAKIFHTVEKTFPHRGKNGRASPAASKNFPYYGKNFSTPWKTFFRTTARALPALTAAALLTGCGISAPPPPELPAGRDAAITAAMSTNRIRIGDPVTLTVTALHRPGCHVTFPNPAKGKDVIVREAVLTTNTLPNGLVQTIHQLRVTSMVITNHILAEGAQIKLATPEGLSWQEPYPFLTLEVISALKPGEQEIRPAKGGLADWPAPRSRWALWGLLALAIAAAGLWALRAFLRTPRTFLHFPPPTPPHEVALAALAALRAKDWIAARRFEPFYVELSGIVRHYLEGRFGLRAPERTTEEFIREAAAARQLAADHRELVADFLTQSDLVKFARHAPDESAMRGALESAERLVHETTPAAPAANGGAP
ncbi:MAG TPA: hypothetical protein PK572_01585 [Kiritimatiellia bacterium]|nr:hypothetical protein [Kiritimatiellia bacterium]